MECLKSEIGELETCLQNGTTIKQLCIASKRVVFAAAQLDEMILRSLTSERKYPTTQTACEPSPPALRSTHSDTEHQQTSTRFAVGSKIRFWIYRHPLQNTFTGILQLSVPHKISVEATTFSCVSGPAFLQAPTGHLEPCTYTHACMTDAESFVANSPWATVVDAQTFVDGWKLGAKWGANNPSSYMSEMVDGRAS